MRVGYLRLQNLLNNRYSYICECELLLFHYNFLQKNFFLYRTWSTEGSSAPGSSPSASAPEVRWTPSPSSHPEIRPRRSAKIAASSPPGRHAATTRRAAAAERRPLQTHPAKLETRLLLLTWTVETRRGAAFEADRFETAASPSSSAGALKTRRRWTAE
jgi:hypothetical protein